MRVAVLSACSLNQWALDFEGNLGRIRLSIIRAAGEGCAVRVGPELEVTGYGCEDHFLEHDTFEHAWEVIACLLAAPLPSGMLVDVGAPVLHRGVAYNCRVLLAGRAVVLVRPKLCLAGDGNYREPRWFRAWPRDRPVEDFVLPECVRTAAGDACPPTVPIGPAIVEDTHGIAYACESCEELWTPDAPHVTYALAGVHIIANASASHHALRKLQDRVALLASATRKCGGAYLYANQLGCDGGRVYYDGSSLVVLNGDVVAQGDQFALNTEVQVVTAAVDLDDVVSYRMASAARGVQAAVTSRRTAGTSEDPLLHRVRLPEGFSFRSLKTPDPTPPLGNVHFYTPEEEIALGPACWLWDYLRRSGMKGFFLPLSGGADSSSTAAIVGSMCQLLVTALQQAPTNGTMPSDKDLLLHEIRRVTGTDGENYIPTCPRELAGRILHTVYMGSEQASSRETRSRAHAVSEEIGAWHSAVKIDAIVSAFIAVFVSVFGDKSQPRFKVRGGSQAENLAMQNIQARTRMVLSYLFAQLTLWARGKSGSLLVLGSANVDEGLRGYLTKYDCSAADINPIGGICKADLKSFLRWASRPEGLNYPSLRDVVEAPPTAELEPITSAHSQTDEDDMGMTYAELTWYGKLRKLHRCGPLSMYRKLLSIWCADGLSPKSIAEKVKFFFRMYAINRHKMTTLTPSYHAENYSPEDNRFDLRQFLYNARWTWQFKAIDSQACSSS